ncbi:MAG: nucleotidyltransferase domain-containing protein [Deltaproteobacteria bacterium]|nr:nucleotidyltransferase domain-containing protein [Deltaproteobacteria bacterium]
MLKQKFSQIQQALLREAKAYYGQRLVSLVFFGSVARGTQTFTSDLDVLIICDRLPRGRINRVREFDRIETALEPMLEQIEQQGFHVRLSPIFKTPDEALKGSPLFLDMVEDAEIYFDRNNFFTNLLQKMRLRLKALGARRIWRGNAWYWDLKPDFKPGEVFEI